tara:strand:- start:29 stop:178 length:150 start_codon:yes stop_codon:yes gene_type:complete
MIYFNMKDTKIIETKKDHYLLMIEGVTIGQFERSQLRHLIEIIDNTIAL